jgi:uncharacterized membrane protein YfcA
MPSAKIRATLAVVLLVLSFVWLWDDQVHGAKGFVSLYVAPLIVIGNLVGAYWGVRIMNAKFPKWPGPQ